MLIKTVFSRTLQFSTGLLKPEFLQITLNSGIKYFAPPKNYDGNYQNKFFIIRRPDKNSWMLLDSESSGPVGVAMIRRGLCPAVDGWNNFSVVVRALPICITDIEIPERQRLRVYEKVPMYPSNLKPPKMQKRLRYMRGPEKLHNTLQLKQFGVIATGGGRLRHEHFEMARLVVARHLDMKRMFAIWRVDPPWQPVTKKGQGQRMGGGKGAIDHYVTPIKTGRVILEVGGKCEYAEVQRMLRIIAERLPFKAEEVSQEILEKKIADEKWQEENNQNKYTMKYIIQNNLGGCHRFLSPFDHKWYAKYV